MLSNQATFLPKGSRLTLTIGSSSLAQNPANLLYLDLPVPLHGAARRHRAARCGIPELATPVSR